MGKTILKGTVTIVTLGCSKNTVDSEHLGYHLAQGGWRVHYDEDPQKGWHTIINTCGFIGDAKEESIGYILRAVELRKRGVITGLWVMGCLSQRYRDSLREEIEGVDGWYGVHDAAALLRALGVEGTPIVGNGRRLSTQKHLGYLKIAEGCNRGCAYCAIPGIRGGYQSAPLEALLREAEELAKGGVKELILIAQEITSYGGDLGLREEGLTRLLDGLEHIPGIEWIRLHYAYPTTLPLHLAERMGASSRVCHYLDIPIQHVNNSVLKAMHRGHTGADIRRITRELRTTIPDIALRTTVMVGYPGEGEKEFNELLDFIREGHFAHLGAFTYCEEEGTPASHRYPDVIPEEEKQRRREAVMAAQQEVSLRFNEGLVGRVMRVLIDGQLGENGWVGRTQYDSPEVDGEVILQHDTPLEIGSFVRVRITEADAYDRQGVVLSAEEGQ